MNNAPLINLPAHSPLLASPLWHQSTCILFPFPVDIQIAASLKWQEVYDDYAESLLPPSEEQNRCFNLSLSDKSLWQKWKGNMVFICMFGCFTVSLFIRVDWLFLSHQFTKKEVWSRDSGAAMPFTVYHLSAGSYLWPFLKAPCSEILSASWKRDKWAV